MFTHVNGRFVVQCSSQGRLRLDKLQEKIEEYLYQYINPSSSLPMTTSAIFASALSPKSSQSSLSGHVLSVSHSSLNSEPLSLQHPSTNDLQADPENSASPPTNEAVWAEQTPAIAERPTKPTIPQGVPLGDMVNERFNERFKLKPRSSRRSLGDFDDDGDYALSIDQETGSDTDDDSEEGPPTPMMGLHPRSVFPKVAQVEPKAAQVAFKAEQVEGSRWSESGEEISPKTILNVDLNALLPIETLGGQQGRPIPVYKATWQRSTNSLVVAVKIAAIAEEVRHTNALSIDRELGDARRAGETRGSLPPLALTQLYQPLVTQEDLEELRREGEISWPLKHENICRMLGVGSSRVCHALVYEYCAGGSLHSLLASSQPFEYLSIALGVANGMAYLHSKDVIHRDLKSTNILLDDKGRAKIADFGLSVVCSSGGEELTAETGTYRWMAPEVIRHESYSSNADVYSFGIVLWQLVARGVPFSDLTPIQAAFAVAKEDRRPVIPEHAPAELARLIELCWNGDQIARPSFFVVVQTLASYIRHRFSPANVSLQTVQMANDALANVQGVNCTVNIGADVMVFGEELEGTSASIARSGSRRSFVSEEGYEKSGAGGRGRGEEGEKRSGLSLAMEGYAG